MIYVLPARPEDFVWYRDMHGSYISFGYTRWFDGYPRSKNAGHSEQFKRLSHILAELITLKLLVGIDIGQVCTIQVHLSSVNVISCKFKVGASYVATVAIVVIITRLYFVLSLSSPIVEKNKFYITLSSLLIVLMLLSAFFVHSASLLVKGFLTYCFLKCKCGGCYVHVYRIQAYPPTDPPTQYKVSYTCC